MMIIQKPRESPLSCEECSMLSPQFPSGAGHRQADPGESLQGVFSHERFLVIVMVMLVVNGNCAAGLRNPAAHVLELNGRVADRKTLGEHFVEPAKNGIA